MITNYRTPFGFPIRWEHEQGKHIENEFLFGMYELLFTKRDAETDILASNLGKYLSAAIKNGYANHIHFSVEEKEISHDQITAYATCMTHFYDFPLASFYKQFRFMKFKGRTQHPSDIIYWFLLKRAWWAFLCLPILYFFCAWSALVPFRITEAHPSSIFTFGKFSLRPKLSGELLWLLKVEAVKENKTLRKCMYPCLILLRIGATIRFGGIKEMISTYFNNDIYHPIVRDLKEF